MWEQMLESGFVSLVDEEDEIVVGYAGRPWKLSGGVQAGVSSAEEWQRFSRAGLREGGAGLPRRAGERRRAAHD